MGISSVLAELAVPPEAPLLVDLATFAFLPIADSLLAGLRKVGALQGPPLQSCAHHGWPIADDRFHSKAQAQICIPGIVDSPHKDLATSPMHPMDVFGIRAHTLHRDSRDPDAARERSFASPPRDEVHQQHCRDVGCESIDPVQG